MLLHNLNLGLTLIAAVLLVPATVFCIQCLAALLPSRRIAAKASSPRPRIGVVMPAHNEEGGIEAAISSILPQLGERDRLVVVADNCTDETAAAARAPGVEVIERTDAENRGKGFALDFGLRHLANDPVEVVIVFDSDCQAHKGMTEALARQVEATARPAQAVYLLSQPPEPTPRDTVSALAFMVKNLVRPRGLARLGLPCLLTGTGMAFPWDVISTSRLASGNIVEDLELSIQLTLAGHAPLLCPEARVTGQLPKQDRGARAQRTRWEHGYLQTASHWIAKLFAQGLLQTNREVLSVALDLAVPPLALLVTIMLLATFTSSAAALAGAAWQPSASMAAGLLAVATCVVISWARFGRDSLPASALLACPLYMLGKVPIYFDFVLRRESRWIRTERDDDGDDENEDGDADEAPATRRLPTILLRKVRFHSITENGCIEHVLDELKHSRGGVLVTPNLDHLNRCGKDASYARLIAEADVVVADGMPLVWASRLQRTPLPERVAGSDLISTLSEAAAVHGRSVFLLGGDPGSAEKAARVLLDRYPGLTVSGTHCPPPGFDYNPDALTEVIDALTSAKPDIIYVGLGSPKQERLIHELREWLPESWWLGVGYSFSFLACEGRRAPMWMQRSGLEWLHRLGCEPQRLARRYLVDGIPFALRLLFKSALEGVTGTALRQVSARPSLAPLKSTRPKHDTMGRDAIGHASREQVAQLVQQSFAAGFRSEWSLARSGFTPASPSLQRIAKERKVRAFVLLGGSLRRTPFREAINRSILDMPLERGRRLLLHWQQQTADLASAYGINQLPMRVMVNRGAPLPAAAKVKGGCRVSIERDLVEFRGTGGILRDLAEEYDDDDFILVANGAQILTAPLAEMVAQLYEAESDVSFVAYQDGTPSGLMLIRCEALRMISTKTYVDMKEQALPAIAQRFKVTHIDHRRSTGMPLYSHQDYLAGLRWWHSHRLAQPSAHTDILRRTDLSRASYRSSFSIVEPGATVEPGACLHDSVVLRGAHVRAGAVAVRSVLCPGSSLEAGETAVDQLITAGSRAGQRINKSLQTI